MVRIVANIISKVISNNMRNGRGSYSARILDHYENPRNVGSFFDKKDVGVGIVGAPACAML